MSIGSLYLACVVISPGVTVRSVQTCTLSVHVHDLLDENVEYVVKESTSTFHPDFMQES